MSLMLSRPIRSRLDLSCSVFSSSVVIVPPPWWSVSLSWVLGHWNWNWNWNWKRGTCPVDAQGEDAGQDERAHERPGVGRVGQVGMRGWVRAVGHDDAHGPLGRPGRLLGLEPPGEERGAQVARHLHDLVETAERDVGQDGAGFVLEEVGQRLVPAEPAGRLDHAGHQHVLEVGGLAHGDGQGREEPGHLRLDDGGQDSFLAPGEGPVGRGPGQSGGAGDVVHRGLGDPLAGQAAQGSVDEADPGRGAVVRSEMPDDAVTPPGRGAGLDDFGPCRGCAHS